MATSKKDESAPLDSSQTFPIVGVGASAGGLDAFKRLLNAIPENSGMAYVLVQHLDPSHESILPEILSRETKLPVHEIADEIQLAPDHIYILPSNKILTSSDGVLKLTPRDKKILIRSIDIFFTSLAEVHKEMAVGVLFSGTGNDGTLGLTKIKNNGGVCFAQSEDSAAYFSMPQNAIDAGVVDFILAPEEIPAQLSSIFSSQTTDHEIKTDKVFTKADVASFEQILQIISQQSGVDFTYYKQPTIYRRIDRRMAITKQKSMSDYLMFLRSDTFEKKALFLDILIPVTSFFRDSQTFQSLKNLVFPELFKNRLKDEPIRIWIAGCSTGEEAYSIAISLVEFLKVNATIYKIQIFASDISDAAIKKARAGIYSKAAVDRITDIQLKKYFIKKNKHYEVSKLIRDMCVFATHNFLKDPPFAKIDLISCRNVLIYMNTFLQRKALTAFHYALKEHGYLVLGKSESTSPATELFGASKTNEKIYIKKSVPSQFIHTINERKEATSLIKDKMSIKNNLICSDFRKSADTILLTRFTPASVVINLQMDIVHIHGIITPYLEAPQGKPTFNLLKMAREGLTFELRNAVHKATLSGTSVIKENIPVKIIRGLYDKDVEAEHTLVKIEVIPLSNTTEPYFLIIFTNSSMLIDGQDSMVNNKNHLNKPELLCSKQLENELSQAREDMRSITEDMEAANEELQSANQELQSSNEEMQSLNEELETSREELQSTNEELMIVNQELTVKQIQLNAARIYAESIVTTIRDPLIVLDKNLRIKTANDSFYHKFNAAKEDTDGKLFYEIQNKLWDDSHIRSLLEKILPNKERLTDYEVNLKLPLNGSRILLLNALKIITENDDEHLILLSIEDITDREQIKNELTKERNKAQKATKVAEEALKSKQRFLSNMSHEIRTPMNSIVGFTNLLLKTDFRPEQSEYLEAIKVSSDVLIALIDDILDLSKVDAGKMTFEQLPFDLNSSISTVFLLFELRIQEKGIKFIKEYDTRIPEVLLGDSLRLRQVLINLLSNALKYTDKGAITVKTLLLEENIKTVTVSFEVSDTGIGIAKEHIKDIFKSFQQATTHTSRLFGGTGLGLTIVKHLVEQQGGSIQVKSKINEGSSFSFAMTFQKTNDEILSASHIRIPVDEVKIFKVLVAEDIALNQLLIRTILSNFGFECDIADNGKIAIEMFQAKTYDIILMDLHMPEMDGCETTDFIRKKLKSTIPIIALTADVINVNFEKCQAIGMNDYIAKPIDEELLYYKIVNLLQHVKGV